MTFLLRLTKPSLRRATQWPEIRRQHIAKQPSCQACGIKKNLEVHHIIPVHVDKTKELDPTNLITLCENADERFCHFIFGHLALSWFKYDPNVVVDAQLHLAAVLNAQQHQDKRGQTKPGEPVTQ